MIKGTRSRQQLRQRYAQASLHLSPCARQWIQGVQKGEWKFGRVKSLFFESFEFKVASLPRKEY
jgi:hypothetical protein